MTVKTIVLFAMLLGAPSVAMIMAAPPEPTGDKSYVVIGTLAELDWSTMSGKIKTDLERTVAFTMTRPDLFKGVAVGDRIAIRLTDQGQVIKIMETTVPELPSLEK
ncbi:MAG: hypothetical protein ACREJN_19155 [Nitrospiraceae bacterium]